MSQAMYCDRCGIMFPAYKIVKSELNLLLPDEGLRITSRYTQSERFAKDLCAHCADDIRDYFNRETKEIANGT